MSDEEIRDCLREMRDDPVPADSLARVRTRVEERTRPRRWFGAWWKAAIVVPLPIISLLVLMLIRRNPPYPVRPAPVVRTQPPPQAPSKPTPVLARRVAPSKPTPVLARRVAPPPPQPRTRPEPSKPEVSNLVRIETEDPDVVIMLVAE